MLRGILGTLLGISAFASVPLVAQSSESAIVEEVVVTGSRIKRSNGDLGTADANVA